MKTTGEVTMKHAGRQYGATYTVRDGKVYVKTHTETRAVELGDQGPETIARNVLNEIVSAQEHKE